MREQFQRTEIEQARNMVVGVNKVVPVLDGRMLPYVNLDNAASTPAFREVLDTVNDFMGWYSSVHRGVGFKSLISTQAYDEAHAITAHFFGADPATNTVIFVRNATEAINKLANRLALSKRDVVLSSFQEHHSNDLPWRKHARVDYIAVDDNGALRLDDMQAKLRAHDGRVRLVAVTGASNVTGYVNPIHEIAALAHEWGAQVLVDAAQLAPHRAIDMRPDGDPAHIDFLVISGHKMYAPFGTGALIGPVRMFLDGAPDLVGGGTVDMVTHDSVMWTGLPDKEEAGSPNVPGAIALAKALQVLSRIGMQAVADHEAQLTAYALRRMQEVPGLTLFGSADPAQVGNRVGVIPFHMQGLHHALVAAVLSYEGGIGVRNGCFCAHPYVLKLLDLKPEAVVRHQQAVTVGDRSDVPGFVRCSFGIYNDHTDVDRLIDMLQVIANREFRGEYRLNVRQGVYAPRDWQVDLKSYWDWS